MEPGCVEGVLMGAKNSRKIIIHNQSPGRVIISSIEVEGGDSCFLLPALSLPMTLEANAEFGIHLVCSAIGGKRLDAVTKAILKINTTTSSTSFPLSIKITAPLSNGAVISLEDTTSVIGFSSSEYSSGRDFIFINRSAGNIEIDDAFMQLGNQGIDFVSFCGQMLPISLAPGEQTPVRLKYTVNDGALHSDRLTIVAAERTYSFPVQIMRSAPSNIANGIGNRQLPLSVVANSASGTITVKLYAGYKGDITIYNAKGAVVAAQKNTDAWIWKAVSGTTPRSAPEEFTVSVRAVDSDGSVLTRSERSILMAVK